MQVKQEMFHVKRRKDRSGKKQMPMIDEGSQLTYLKYLIH